MMNLTELNKLDEVLQLIGDKPAFFLDETKNKTTFAVLLYNNTENVRILWEGNTDDQIFSVDMLGGGCVYFLRGFRNHAHLYGDTFAPLPKNFEKQTANFYKKVQDENANGRLNTTNYLAKLRSKAKRIPLQLLNFYYNERGI